MSVTATLAKFHRSTNPEDSCSNIMEAYTYEMIKSVAQIQEELEQARLRNTELSVLLFKYQERLNEQSFHRDMLEIDLNQHKETLASKLREIAEQQCVIQAQGFLLDCAREEAQNLAIAISEKDRTIANLHIQIGQRYVKNAGNDGSASRKKRKIGS
ncbi:hypothetical protein QBC46DRAFT_414587 [Diplogelasinospora grovesii]|uniref:Uncharacterized protein n=1 Tax=Diplogelasinospora grovesii TaxID=303347 RepID=A0AAN6RYZ8_9PEZI|nr:hypothetical protein QBC46DRAFT_414587 [Diplogelasinospora grovesii]